MISVSVVVFPEPGVMISLDLPVCKEQFIPWSAAWKLC